MLKTKQRDTEAQRPWVSSEQAHAAIKKRSNPFMVSIPAHSSPSDAPAAHYLPFGFPKHSLEKE